MIQRIQTLLLLGVVIALILNLFVPIWNSGESANIELSAFSIQSAKMSNTGTLEMVNSSLSVFYIGILMCLSMVLALFIIMKYNNRTLQIKLCHLLTLLLLGILGTYFIAIPLAKSLMIVQTNGAYKVGFFLPIVSIFLVMGARYFINKDEQLVRSVDRLR